MIRKILVVAAGLLIVAAPAASASTAGGPKAGKHKAQASPAAQTQASPAAAVSNDDDYTALCTLSIDPASPSPGQDVTVSGTTAAPNAGVVVFLNDDPISETTSDASRQFSTTFEIPPDTQEGDATITAQELGDDTDPTTGCGEVLGFTIVGNSIVCTPNVVTVGEDVTCEARTFQTDSPVDWTFNSTPIDLGTTTAGSDGIATITFPTPDVALGPHTVTASGTGLDGDPLVESATITVVSGTLPTTGSSSTMPMTKLGLGLVAAGGLVLLGARKRRQRVSRHS